MSAAETQATNTAERILDIAERLVQTRGFNGFSYADVAAELGITKAGLHYHYPGKAELGEALIARYSDRFALALEEIDSSAPDAPAKLDAYAELYAAVLRGDRMCLCGMLAAEYQTLPERMRAAVMRFFEENERWLANVLAEGHTTGTLSFAGSSRDAARALFGTLEGAMLVSRPYGEVTRFQSAADRALATLALDTRDTP